ncbi:HAD-IIB family hydrolase [Mycoplasma elephantis]|uniref:HAD-IIB family hydrolase n=1 Tax=Mycoplasma elephantis TaxID=114882 RepID=UPI00047FF9BC|nr:HAD family hydrolase [Mycoplasma elephantis]
MDIKKILGESKIIFLDLDGTLFDSKKQLISPKNGLFLDNMKKSKEIIISTSRGFDNKVYKVAKKYGINKLILYNGAKLYDNFSLIKTNYIDIKVLSNLFKYLTNRKIIFVTFDEQFTNIYLYSKLQIVLASFVRGVNTNSINNLSINNKIFKISLILKTPFFTQRLVDNLRILFPGLDIFSSTGNYVVEITSRFCNKGSAASEFCEIMNVDPSYAIHIGDSMTDATCISMLGTVIAMGNGAKEFKKNATYVGPRSKNGGLYNLFYKK